MSNFDPNAVIRGAQLTVVGAVRALRNPGLFKYEHYRQAVIAVVAGLLIRLLIETPIILTKTSLWLYASVVSSEASTWSDKLVSRLDFVERYLTPTLDELFMDSLRWVDFTYASKHKSDDPQTLRAMYYPNLHAGIAFVVRYGRRAGTSLLIYLLSYLPVVGRFVLPAASFYAFNAAVGPIPAMVIFGGGLALPRRYLVVFLQSYFSSRSLMRDLLEPYFSRVKFTKEQKRRWFRDREGLLFGFAVGFYIFLKIPLLGVLIYGIAEASTAYLITKITDPPPSPAQAEGFAESQTQWKNRVEFLKLPLDKIDAQNVLRIMEEHTPRIGKHDNVPTQQLQ